MAIIAQPHRVTNTSPAKTCTDSSGASSGGLTWILRRAMSLPCWTSVSSSLSQTYRHAKSSCRKTVQNVIGAFLSMKRQKGTCQDNTLDHTVHTTKVCHKVLEGGSGSSFCTTSTKTDRGTETITAKCSKHTLMPVASPTMPAIKSVV
eukprot:4347712-Amphidinium_carterae.1